MAQADPPGDSFSAKPGSPSVGVEGAGGYILAGLLVFGGIGVWLDRSLDMAVWTPVGIVVGCLLGGYLVYLRVVRPPDANDDDVQDGSSNRMAQGDSP